MLYLYATVYNNENTIINSIESLNKIDIKKQFLIVDNYSYDGTYEILEKIKNKYNIKLKRYKCTRGKGRQLAMELAYNESNNDDLFMMFDLDTVYTSLFVKFIEKGIKILNKNEIFLNQLCYKEINFKIPWRNLNNGEDWERMANFIHSGYVCTNVNAKYYQLGNNYVGKNREKRYASGINYYKRVIKNQIDLFRGWDISNYKNLKLYIKFSNAKKSHFIFLFIILIYIKIFDNTYKYSGEINILYVRKNMKIINFNN